MCEGYNHFGGSQLGLKEKITDAITGGRSRALITDAEVGGNEVLLNVTSSYSRSWGASVTRHAVEEGAPVTDNVVKDPFSVSLSVVLSDTFDLLTLNTLYEKSVTERMEQLLTWRDESTLLFFLFDEEIENVVIKSITEKSEAALGKGKALDIELAEIRIAKAETTGGIPNVGKTELVTEPS